MFKENPVARDKILNILSQLGWRVLNLEELKELRDSGDILLKSILVEKLKELNLGVIDSDQKAEEFIKGLENLRGDLMGNEEALNFLRGNRTIYLEKENREANVKTIDFKNLENNSFLAARELTFVRDKMVRFDIALFINGIPIGIIETKNPEIEDPIGEGFLQIGRYQREAPEFLKLIQFYNLSEGINLFYGATWHLLKKNLYQWRGNRFAEVGENFFDPKNILEILEDYVVFFRREEGLSKIVLKPHQIEAVRNLVERVKQGKKKFALIWHTQGSGKTLTMMVLASKLRKLEELENPTILVLVDRIELEDQMVRNLKSIGFSVDQVESEKDLQNKLSSDRRGLIVSTIQKFQGAPENLNARKNIIVLVDEAHRSQEGNLGNYLRRALPNAFYFGFTGTPIDKGKVGRGTFETFGREDPGGYSHKYSIVESIRDGTTVPLYYTLAEQDLLVNKELLEKEFFETAEKEGVTSIESLNKILERAVKLREFLKSSQRIEKIGKFVAENFKQNIEPLGFKAFLVAVDREGCALYKKELDKYLPREYSRVIYSQSSKDPQKLREFYLTEAEEKQLKIDFLSPKKMPKIFIVTEKLLTGYDAPILYCMYLDKPIKDHALLQAIARINRPLEAEEVNRKTDGLIVDFVGVFENLKKALRFDSKVIEGAVQDLDFLKKSFEKEMKKMANYLKIHQQAEKENDLEKIINYFLERRKREAFIISFKKIQDLYEIISPDKCLGPYLENYNRLVSLYKILINHFCPEEKEPERRLQRKTKGLIRERTKIGEIKPLPIYKIDENVIEKVKEEKASEPLKVIKLTKSITAYIEKNRREQPYLFPLEEMVEGILEEFRNQIIEAKVALEKLSRLAWDVSQAKRVQTDLGLSLSEFTIYWMLNQFGVERTKLVNLAKDLTKELKEYSFWMDNPEQERNLRLQFFAIFQRYGQGEKMFEVVDKILNNLRRIKHEG